MSRSNLLGKVGIRTRIAGGSLIIAMLGSVAAGIVINSQIERIVREGTVAVLRSDSAPYVSALEKEPGETFDLPGPSQLVAVIAPDNSTPVNSLPDSLATMLPRLDLGTTAHSVMAHGTQYVVLTTHVLSAGQEWTVIAARNAAEEETVLGQMRMLLIASLSGITLVVTAAAWLLTTASLGPVRQLRRSAETLSATSTTELLAVGETNDEIARLASTLNDLIERLRASTQRERQLVSDASHELRTPIAILSAQLQIALAEASSIDQLTNDIRGAQRNVDRLSTLVTSLLELSTIEALAHAETASLAELGREAEEAVDRARFRAREGATVIEYRGPLGAADGEASFAIRAEDFGRIIDNLTSNALRAIGDSGELDVELEPQSDTLRLIVSDTGGGLDPAFVEHALERFTRQDAARAGASGAGLGLAIVAAIVAGAGGTITLDNRPGSGLRVVITIPRAGASPARRGS